MDEFSIDDYRAAVRAAEPAEIRELSKHCQWQVRATLAHNANLPEDVLLRLAQDSNPVVRAGVLANKNCTESIVHLIASVADFSAPEAWPLRCALAGHRYTPSEVLYSLFASGKWSVWASLVHNINCPADMLEQFAKLEVKMIAPKVDDNKHFRKIAKMRLGIEDEEEDEK